MEKRTIRLFGNGRAKALEAVKAAPEDWSVSLSAPKRSDAANRRMWASLKDIADQVVWYGQKLSKEDWKDVLTASLRKSRVVPSIDPGGGFVVTGLHTSQMSGKEMNALLELAYCFGAEHGVVFSDPTYEDYQI